MKFPLVKRPWPHYLWCSLHFHTYWFWCGSDTEIQFAWVITLVILGEHWQWVRTLWICSGDMIMKSYVTHWLTPDNWEMLSINTVHVYVLKNALLQCKVCCQYIHFFNLIFIVSCCIFGLWTESVLYSCRFSPTLHSCMLSTIHYKYHSNTLEHHTWTIILLSI